MENQGLTLGEGFDLDFTQANEADIKEEDKKPEDQATTPEDDDKKPAEGAESEQTPEEGGLSDDDLDDYLQNHFKYSREKGLLLLPDDFEFTGDNIEQAYLTDMKTRQSVVVDNIVNGMPEKLRAVVEYGLNSAQQGLEVDLSEIMQVNSTLEDLQSISFEGDKGEDAAKEFLINYYEEEARLKPRAAKSAVQAHIDDEDLVQVATEIKEGLEQQFRDAMKDMNETAKKEKAKKDAEQLQFSNSVNEVINSMEWDPTTKQAIKTEFYNGGATKKIDYIFTKDPKSLVQLLQYLSLYDPEKGFKENIVDKKSKQKAAKKVVDNFFQAAASQKVTKSKAARQKRKLALDDFTQIEFH